MKILNPVRRGDGHQHDAESRSGVLLRLALTSDPGLLCAVRGAVERLTEAFGFSAEESRAVTRAVDEALTNIIRHAYNGQFGRPIELYFKSLSEHADHRKSEGLEILICDRGPEVKPEQMCGRALDDVKPGGLGWHFIQESMDVVEYKRAKGTNRLRLVKYTRASKKN
jgi:serine/threonine-protein kinase RsbW